eukprot:15435398-Alexandrium_andersonii.AAC.1
MGLGGSVVRDAAAHRPRGRMAATASPGHHSAAARRHEGTGLGGGATCVARHHAAMGGGHDRTG